MKKWLVIIAILTLLVLHQDYWHWDRAELVYGFVPWNMAWHIGVSLATAGLWIVVCLFCWPHLDEEFTGQDDVPSKGGDQKGGDQ